MSDTRKTIIERAADKLSEFADDLCIAHTVAGQWPDGKEAVRDEYDDLRALADELYAIADAAPVEPASPTGAAAPTQGGTQPTERERLLGEALANVLIRAGVLSSGGTGPALLAAAESYCATQGGTDDLGTRYVEAENPTPFPLKSPVALARIAQGGTEEGSRETHNSRCAANWGDRCNCENHPTCPACDGSGEGRGVDGQGPNTYEVDIPCPRCGGTGYAEAERGEAGK